MNMTVATNLGALLRRAQVNQAFAGPKRARKRITFDHFTRALRDFALEHYARNHVAIPTRPIGKPNKGDTR